MRLNLRGAGFEPARISPTVLKTVAMNQTRPSS